MADEDTGVLVDTAAIIWVGPLEGGEDTEAGEVDGRSVLLFSELMETERM